MIWRRSSHTVWAASAQPTVMPPLDPVSAGWSEPPEVEPPEEELSDDDPVDDELDSAAGAVTVRTTAPPPRSVAR